MSGVFPRTICPEGSGSLDGLLAQREKLPLWEAGMLVQGLSRFSPEELVPLDPRRCLVGPEGQAALAPGEQSGGASYCAPPEYRLHQGQTAGPAAAVYSLCALFYHLLAGEPLSEEARASLRLRRSCLHRLAQELALSGESARALWALLEQGLRLEPSRRQPGLKALGQALEEAEQALNREAAGRTKIWGTAGALRGRELRLAAPLVLGRQPEKCQVLFPPGTGGVSRRHCKIELRWGAVLVTDLASSYGTFLDEVRLCPWTPVEWERGQDLFLGSSQQRFALEKEA